MKKTIFLLVLLFSINLNSQDKYPVQQSYPYRFDGANTNIQLNSNIVINGKTPLKQTEFIRGWHWDGNPYMVDLFPFNQVDINSYNLYTDDCKKLYKNQNICMHALSIANQYNNLGYVTGYSHNRDYELFHTKSIEYEAALPVINENSYKSFIDINNPIFGFKTITSKETVIDNGNVMLKLSKNNTDLIPQAGSDHVLVLSDPWPNDILKSSVNTYFEKGKISDSQNDKDNDEEYDYYTDYHGRYMWVAVRVKCLENLTEKDANDKTPVLSIKLPFNNKGSITNLKFAELPSA